MLRIRLGMWGIARKRDGFGKRRSLRHPGANPRITIAMIAPIEHVEPSRHSPSKDGRLSTP
ncbi:MAG: hypothetical protein ACLPSW_10550, partial [Roseiarcus sp.]